MNKKEWNLKGKRRAHVFKQKIVLSFSAFLFVVCFTFVFQSFMTSAHDAEKSIAAKTSYTSIQIESGDSLWSIAEEYKPSYQSTRSYIKELISLNGLTSEDIHANQYLIVVHDETNLM